MKNILLTASVFLLGISSSAYANEIVPSHARTLNDLCLNSQKAAPVLPLTNPLIAQTPIIVDGPRTGWERGCVYYTMRDKDGKIYECQKCSYGGPYCWRKH
jgi:hypothetical protein